MKSSFEKQMTMPGGVVYECQVTKGYFSNIGNEHEKSCWLTRKISKYQIERVAIHLGSRYLFLSVYINGECAVGIVQITSEQLLTLIGSRLSIEETFEYCRKTFCSELSGIGTKPKAEKKQRAAVAQPDLFEMA